MKKTKENKERWEKLINKYPPEPDIDDINALDKFYEDKSFSEDEIKFMWEYDLATFMDKWPMIANEYAYLDE